MFQDIATAEENLERFVRRVLASETIWGIRDETGFQSCGSNDNDNRSVILFWSDAAYARRAVRNDYADCVPATIDLFSFLFRWLPGMASDRALAGPNYTADLCGLEVEPLELQAQLLDAMPKELLSVYQDRLSRELSGQRTTDS